MHGSCFYTTKSLHIKRQGQELNTLHSAPWCKNYHHPYIGNTALLYLWQYHIIISRRQNWLPTKRAQALGPFSMLHKLKTRWGDVESAIGRCCSRNHHGEHARLFLPQGLPLKAPSAGGSICVLAAGWSLSLWPPQRCPQKAFQLQEGCKSNHVSRITLLKHIYVRIHWQLVQADISSNLLPSEIILLYIT
jgi:hypothetical protein